MAAMRQVGRCQNQEKKSIPGLTVASGLALAMGL
jgi:hypothetical protein